MSKPCRLTFFAYMRNESTEGYDMDDLVNGIAYAVDLLSAGFSREPHDEFSLKGYIDWAIEEMRNL